MHCIHCDHDIPQQDDLFCCPGCHALLSPEDISFSGFPAVLRYVVLLRGPAALKDPLRLQALLSDLVPAAAKGDSKLFLYGLTSRTGELSALADDLASGAAGEQTLLQASRALHESCIAEPYIEQIIGSLLYALQVQPEPYLGKIRAAIADDAAAKDMHAAARAVKKLRKRHGISAWRDPAVITALRKKGKAADRFGRLLTGAYGAAEADFPGLLSEYAQGSADQSRVFRVQGELKDAYFSDEDIDFLLGVLAEVFDVSYDLPLIPTPTPSGNQPQGGAAAAKSGQGQKKKARVAGKKKRAGTKRGSKVLGIALGALCLAALAVVVLPNLKDRLADREKPGTVENTEQTPAPNEADSKQMLHSYEKTSTDVSMTDLVIETPEGAAGQYGDNVTTPSTFRAFDGLAPELDFRYPTVLYDEVEFQNPKQGADVQVRFSCRNGADELFVRAARTDSLSDSEPWLREEWLAQAEDGMLNVEMIESFSGLTQWGFFLRGEDASQPGTTVYKYYCIHRSGDGDGWLYCMLLRYDAPADEQDRLHREYYAAAMYALCAFSGDGKELPNWETFRGNDQ